MNDDDNEAPFIITKSLLGWFLYHVFLIVGCVGWGLVRGSDFPSAFVGSLPIVAVGIIAAAVPLYGRVRSWISSLRASRSSEPYRRRNQASADELVPFDPATEAGTSGHSLRRPTALSLVAGVSVLLIVASAYLAFRNGAGARSNKAVDEKTSEGYSSKGSEDNTEISIIRKPGELRAVLLQYKRISADIERILREGLEEKNIGGALAVVATNWQFNGDQGIFRTPEALGFQRITTENSLVNLALDNKVRIDRVDLNPLPGRTFRVAIRVTNLTSLPLTCYIRKGQVFELKDTSELWYRRQTGQKLGPDAYPQGVAKSDGDDGVYVVPPRDPGTIEFSGLCFNERLAPPEGRANIALYELKDNAFKDAESLHRMMRRFNSDR